MVSLGRRPREVPLARDPSTRFIPLVIGAMVFLSAMVLASAMAIEKVTGQWQGSQHPRLTVEIPPDAAGDAAEVVRILNQVPGITGAAVVGDEEILRVLEAWTGGDPDLALLPLPTLVEAQASSSDAAVAQRVRSILDQRFDGLTVYAEPAWLSDVRTTLGTIQLVAALMLVFIALVSVATIVHVTRTALSVHRSTIEILHQIGARDSYVANQFQFQFFFLALLGGLAGTGLAVAAVFLVRELSGGLDAALLPAVIFGLREWATIGALPAVAALVTMLAARLTVTTTLGRMP